MSLLERPTETAPQLIRRIFSASQLFANAHHNRANSFAHACPIARPCRAPQAANVPLPLISCILNPYFLMTLMKQLALIKISVRCNHCLRCRCSHYTGRTDPTHSGALRCVGARQSGAVEKHFADDCVFADEKGRIFDKPKLIADITTTTGRIFRND